MEKNTLFDYIIFSLAVSLTIIGIYEAMTKGIAESYWIFMIVFAFLIIYNYRKIMKKNKDDKE